MATINGSDKMMGMGAAAPMRPSTPSTSSREKDILALLWVIIALNAILMIAMIYTIWYTLSSQPASVAVIPPSTPPTQQLPSSGVAAAAQGTPAAAPRGFYGKILSADGKKLSIQEVIQPAPGGVGKDGKVYDVTLDDKLVLKHQIANTSKAADAAPWIAEDGKREDLKAGVFGIFRMDQDLDSPALTMNSADYADKLPFNY